ncbi:MAG: SGNH/GDSL hydrolase family protein [Mucilaginibacter sp.]
MNNSSNTFLGTPFKWVLLVHTASLLLCVFFLIVNPAFSKEPPAKDVKWVGTWGTARQLVERNNMPPAPGLTNNTLRQVVCVSIGGKNLRLRFSNEFSKSPVTMKVVQIAVSKGGNVIDEATTKQLKFNGKDEITMEPGGEAMSDPIAFDLKPRELVAITIAFGETSETVTGHPGSRTTSYILTGNQTAPNTDYTTAVPAEHWYVITGIDVENSKKNAGSVVTFGDSITDGRGSGTNKQDRWPDILAMDLLKNKATRNVGVLNMGIGGNAVLRGGLGPYAISRFEHDVLKQSGIKWLIIFEGTNDIGGAARRDSATISKIATDLIAAFDKMITEAHAKGIKVYGATITPFKKNGYYSANSERTRQKVNEWIRTSGKYDAVIDFDKITRDTADPEIMSETFVPGPNANDHLHLNEVGYKTMGDSIDPALFE